MYLYSKGLKLCYQIFKDFVLLLPSDLSPMPVQA